MKDRVPTKIIVMDLSNVDVHQIANICLLLILLNSFKPQHRAD